MPVHGKEIDLLQTDGRCQPLFAGAEQSICASGLATASARYRRFSSAYIAAMTGGMPARVDQP